MPASAFLGAVDAASANLPDEDLAQVLPKLLGVVWIAHEVDLHVPLPTIFSTSNQHPSHQSDQSTSFSGSARGPGSARQWGDLHGPPVHVQGALWSSRCLRAGEDYLEGHIKVKAGEDYLEGHINIKAFFMVPSPKPQMKFSALSGLCHFRRIPPGCAESLPCSGRLPPAVD